MDTRDLNFVVEDLESTEDVDFAQAATATLYENWLDITSVDVNFQKRLSNFLEGKSGKQKRVKAQEAMEKYCRYGEPRKSDHQTRPNPDLPDLQYRRIVHLKRQSQNLFLNSIPDRVQVRIILFAYCSSGSWLTCNHRNMGPNIGLLCVMWAWWWSHLQPTFGSSRNKIGTWN